MDRDTVEFYNQNATRLSAVYMQADMSGFYNVVDDLLHGKGRVLDVGCGEGRDACALAMRGYVVTGCDASIEMIGCARARALHANCSFQVKSFPLGLGDSILNEHFDLVFANALLMHIPKSERDVVVRQMASLVMPGKYLYFSWCNRDSADERLYEKIDEDEVLRLISGAGMSIVSMYVTNDALSRRVDWTNLISRKDIVC